MVKGVLLGLALGLAAIAGEGERADFVRESAAFMRARLEQRWK